MKSVIQNQDGTQTVVAVEDGNLVTGTIQDCTAIAERAKAMHNEGLHGTSEMRLAASVPYVMIDKYLNDNFISLQEFKRSQEHQRRFLNDPALAHFRVWKGRV